MLIEGRFTLDRTAAREKMSRYQLANARAYVLELVGAAVQRGATRIDCDVSAHQLRLSFDGPPWSAHELERLEVAAFESADGALQQLSIGLTAALGLKPRWVTLDSPGLRLEMRPGKPDRISSRPGTERTVITVRQAFNPQLVMAALRDLLGPTSEEELLIRHCCWARLPIMLNGRRLSRGFESFARHGAVLIEAEGLEGIGGLNPDHPSVVLVLKNGVLVESLPLKSGPVPFSAVVEGRDLRQDLSHSALVRDEQLGRLLGAVELARAVSLQRLGLELIRQPQELAPLAAAFREELLRANSLDEARRSTLARLPIWPTAGGEHPVTFHQLLEASQQLGFLPYAVEGCGESLQEASHVLLCSDGKLVDSLSRLLEGRSRNVTRRLLGQRQQRYNYERWRAQPSSARLGPGSWLARQGLDGLEGEAGLCAADSSARLKLVKSGCLLHIEYPSGWPRGLEVVVSADFKPTPNYDGVVKDQTFGQVLAVVMEALPPLYRAVARSRPNRERRRLLREYLRVVSQERAVARLGEDCGYHGPPAREKLDIPEEVESFPWVPTNGRKFLSLRDLRRAPRWQWTEPGTRIRGAGILCLDPTDRRILEFQLGASALEQVRGQPVRETPAPERAKASETAFLAALRGELHRVHARDPELLWGLNLGQLRLDSHSGQRVADFSSLGFCLDRHHPLVAAALTGFQREPRILTFLVSTLYTTLNRARAEITDEDEQKLQHSLIAYALGATAEPAGRSESREVSGLLEPMARLGVATGQATAGVIVRFYVDGAPGSGTYLGSAQANPNFEFPLAERYQDGLSHRLYACVEDPTTAKLVNLPGSPRPFIAAARPVAAPLGRLEKVDVRGRAFGWCLDPNSPVEPACVHFYLDGPAGRGEFIGAASADVPRTDVNEWGHPGQHGFEFEIAAEYRDGSRHLLFAYGIDLQGGHNPELSGSPLPFV